MVLETHLGRSSIPFTNIISLCGLNSDGSQVGFKWATNASVVSLICFSDDSFSAIDQGIIAQIMQLADRLDIAPWRCQD